MQFYATREGNVNSRAARILFEALNSHYDCIVKFQRLWIVLQGPFKALSLSPRVGLPTGRDTMVALFSFSLSFSVSLLRLVEEFLVTSVLVLRFELRQPANQWVLQ